MKTKSYMQGPRWAGIKEFLFELSLKCKLGFTILEEDKGWFRTTIYYELSGKEIDIREFFKLLKLAERNYNL